MTVSWNTYSQLSHPSVRYGKHPDSLNKVAVSDVSVTYKTSTTYNNHVKITGLESDTVYYYQPMHGNAAPLSFKTSRSAGDEEPYTVAVVVDMGVMGPDGLTTRVGTGGANPLKPGDHNTIQSLQAQGADTDFLWHCKQGSPSSDGSSMLIQPQRAISPMPTTGSRRKSRASFPTPRLPMVTRSTRSC
jgi:hypothetical protein